MVEKIFIQVLNMSLTASFVILAVLVFRLFLKRAPKIFSYLLWAIVLFRLLCPVSFSLGFSFLGAINTPKTEGGQIAYIPQDIGYMQEPKVDLPAPVLEEAVNSSLPAATPMVSMNPMQVYLFIGARIWLLGMGALLLYSGISYGVLMRRLKDARQKDGAYGTDRIETPFVLGIFHPHIYLPQCLEGRERDYILLHEQIHIRRRDHVTRAVGYFALSIHWFNPLVWVAYFLSERDMEMSCDEAVVREMGSDVKKDYTRSLLSLATGRRLFGGVPPAFGEGNTKGRIKNVLGYRKPAGILLAAVAVVCLLAAVFLTANPREKEEALDAFTCFGVVSELEEGSGRLVVTVPGLGEMELPQADEIYPYIEIDFSGLEAGDLVKITFPAGEEVSFLETYPGQFSSRAESIAVMGRGFFLEAAEGGGYRFSVPLGMASEAREGDILEIYHHDPAIDGQMMEKLTAVPVLSVDQERQEILVELTKEEAEVFLSEFGFGISCSVTGSGEETQNLETGKENSSEEKSEAEPLTEVPPEDGQYWVYARSISRSLRGIDRYVLDIESEELPALAFAGDCVFQVNEEMDSIRYNRVSFEDFADFVDAGFSYLNTPVRATFQDGLIVEADLESAYYEYGISYEKVPADIWYDFILEEQGEDALSQYYTLSGTVKADVADVPGEEQIEIYTGNIGDGDSGIVMIRDKDGSLLYTNSAHISRAGWNNIYVGEMDGTGFILLVHIEDRDTYGDYAYHVFRLGEEAGEIRQIAGSRFTFGDGITYDDSMFFRWVEKMSAYLKNSHLILSTQEGELRIEQVSEADKYNYDTLRRR